MANRIQKPYIMVVEDDATIADVICYNLQKEGYKLKIITDADQVPPAIEEAKPDLIILDVMLPTRSGIELCAELRQNDKTANIPIIMCSARGSEFDKIIGFESGADDYLAKPLSYMELSTRIKAIFRRTKPILSKREILIGNIRLDLQSHQVFCNDKEVYLAPTEFQILRLMMCPPNTIFSRKKLIAKIWDCGKVVNERVVDVHIAHLRSALAKASLDRSNPIKTVRNAGYKFIGQPA